MTATPTKPAKPAKPSAPSAFDFAAHDIAAEWLEGVTAERVLATAKVAGVPVTAEDIAVVAEEVTRSALFGLGAARDTSPQVLAAGANAFWRYLEDSREMLAAGTLTDGETPCSHPDATAHTLQFGPLLGLTQAVTVDPTAGTADDPIGLTHQFTLASARSKCSRNGNGWMEHYGEGLADAAAREMYDRVHTSHALTGHVWETDSTRQVSQNGTKFQRSRLLALASTDPATNDKNRFSHWLAMQAGKAVEAVADHLIHKRSREQFSLNEQIEADGGSVTERGALLPGSTPTPEELALAALPMDERDRIEHERAQERLAAAAAHLDEIAARTAREQTGRYGLYERLGKDARRHLSTVLGIPVRKPRRPLDPSVRDRHMAVLGLVSGTGVQRDETRVSDVALAAVRLAFWSEMTGDPETAVSQAVRNRHLLDRDGTDLVVADVINARAMASDLFDGYDLDVLEAFTEQVILMQVFGGDPRTARLRAARAAGDIAREVCSDLRRPAARDFERMSEAAIKYVASAVGGHDLTVRHAVAMLLRCEFAAITDRDNESVAAKTYMSAEDKIAAGALLREDVAWTDWWTTLRSITGAHHVLGNDPYRFRARLLSVAAAALDK